MTSPGDGVSVAALAAAQERLCLRCSWWRSVVVRHGRAYHGVGHRCFGRLLPLQSDGSDCAYFEQRRVGGSP